MGNAMLVIHADWDSEAGCWYATSDDIPGLATGADTIEDLIERLKVIVPELVELNEVPVEEHVTARMLWREYRSSSAPPLPAGAKGGVRNDRQCAESCPARSGRLGQAGLTWSAGPARLGASEQER